MTGANALADQLEALAAKARGPYLSIPGDPAWPLERDRRINAVEDIAELCRDNLPAIIAALRTTEQAHAERDALLAEAVQIIGQIELDHRYPPAPDSMERRIERARDWLGDYRSASDA